MRWRARKPDAWAVEFMGAWCAVMLLVLLASCSQMLQDRAAKLDPTQLCERDPLCFTQEER